MGCWTSSPVSFAVPNAVTPAEPSGGEFALIERYFAGLDHGDAVVLGNGDDAAVLALQAGEQLVVSADTMLENVHFPAAAPADRVAYRAMAAALSDLAAMGARPLGATLALNLPSADAPWLDACRRGLAAAVADFSMPLVGGDLTRGPLSLAVQVIGAAPAGTALCRGGAQVGDALWVSGPLGDAAAGLAVERGELALSDARAAALRGAFWRPAPALALGQKLRDWATACIDVSDGLLADAGHLARASGVRIDIEAAALPLSAALREAVNASRAVDWALSGGDDYVLCFSLPAGIDAPAGCTWIGAVSAGRGVHCDREPAAPGYRHFS